MKPTMIGLVVSVFALCVLSFSDSVMAKKGGIGEGGGYSSEGALYHSHSDRSYSGKDDLKGQGNAYGKSEEKGAKKGSPKASQMNSKGDSQKH